MYSDKEKNNFKIYAKKYKINLTYVKNNLRRYKKLKLLASEIYNYEINVNNNIINGLFFIA